MKVLVTGAAGFVGSMLVPQLLSEGHEVVAFDNLSRGGRSLLPNFIDPRFRFMKGDVRDAHAVRSAVREVDAVVHLAAIVGYPACRATPELATSVNVEGTRNVAAACGRGQTLVFASTGSNYGKLDDMCTEESALNPLSLYAVTKTEGESICLSSSAEAVVLRIATAFGLSLAPRFDLLVNQFVYRAKVDREIVVYERHHRRTLLHVRDIARALGFAVAHHAEMHGQSFNVGAESMNYTKGDIARAVCDKVPCVLRYAEFDKDEDQRDYVVSYRKIRALGFEPTIDLARGIDEVDDGLEVMDMPDRHATP